MKHQRLGKPKRGHCDGCPATKHLKLVTISGTRASLCPHCITVLKQMQDVDLNLSK